MRRRFSQLRIWARERCSQIGKRRAVNKEVLSDYVKVVLYSVGATFVVYAADVINDEAFLNVLGDGSLFLLIVGLCGNLVVRLADGRVRLDRPVLLFGIIPLMVTSAGLFAPAVINTSQADNKLYAKIALSLFLLVLGPLALITSIEAVQHKRKLRRCSLLVEQYRDILELLDGGTRDDIIEHLNPAELGQLRDRIKLLRRELQDVEKAIFDRMMGSGEAA